MKREQKDVLQYRGIDLSTGRIHMDPGAAQIDLNGDRRRFGTWRTRAGYARLIANSVTRTAVATDNFNRADGGLGGNWTEYGSASHGIVSNQILIDSTTTQIEALSGYSGSSFKDDQYSQIDIAVAATVVNRGGAAVRANALGAYVLYYELGAIKLGRMDLSFSPPITAETFGSYAYTAVAGDTLLLVVVGAKLYGFLENGLILTGEDETYSTGLPGVASQNTVGKSPTSIEFDNWEGGNAIPDPVKVDNAPNRLFLFERDDNAAKIMIANAKQMDEFDAGAAEWTS